MNKYAKLLAIALLVSSINGSIFAAGGPKPKKEFSCTTCLKDALYFPACLKEDGKTEKYPYEEKGCLAKAQWLGTWGLRGGKFVVLAGAIAGTALAVKYFTAKNKDNQMVNEASEAATETEDVA
jgi:hypothetical protein